jgi:hypothetical protein
MRRGLAIITFIGLLAGSVALWLGTGCCGDTDCCKTGICPMHNVKHSAFNPHVLENDTRCHHSPDAPLPGPAAQCRATGECSLQFQALHLAPQLRAVLPGLPAVIWLSEARAERGISSAAPATGFGIPPFEPPRLPTFSSSLLIQ